MSANEMSTPTARHRRRRLLAHAGVFSAAGILCLAVSSPTSSAAPTVQEGRFLAADTVDVVYTCAGTDAATITLLSGLGLASFPLMASITSAAVEPSPSPGEEFEMSFNWSFTLDDALVAKAVLAGGGSSVLEITGVNTMGVVSGATGADVAGNGGPTTVDLGNGTVLPVGYDEGPFTGTFTRTAEVDVPITFVPKTITASVVPGTIPLVLQISCTTGSESVLSVLDQTGVPPTTTTSTRPAVVAPTTTVAVAPLAELPRTGSSSNLFMVLLALGLIDVGYLAWSAGRPSRSGRVSSVG